MSAESDIAEVDQAMAEICNTWPPMLFRFFSNLKSEGFDGNEALSLTSGFMRDLIRAGGKQDGDGTQDT